MAMQAMLEEEEGGKDKEGSDHGEVGRSSGETNSRASSTAGGGLRRAASKRSFHSSQGQRSSRGSSRGGQSSQVGAGPCRSFSTVRWDRLQPLCVFWSQV